MDVRRVSVVHDAAAVSRLFDRDPVGSCMVAEEIADHGIGTNAVGAELWTCAAADESLCYAGVNLIPLRGDAGDLHAFADKALSESRPYTWLIGGAELVMPMWQRLAPVWGAARYVRSDQPLLAIAGLPRCAIDPAVRQVRPDELDAYLTATATEIIAEFGVDPRLGERGSKFRGRLANLIAVGRAWARFERGEVVFKAELGVQSSSVGLIQGVWVHPERRGQGLCVPGTATIVSAIVATGRIACGYVNHSNVAARAAYARVGFRQVGSIASVLLGESHQVVDR
ncbi:hypothetical protein MSIMFB_03120 [Mycobacterium simulans]|uniref:N-acetyltransferase domain-containing protein n=1 Tax=Mycobacterium simulans TaxID=627089 RepID=A0A7Z7INP5_9MYCO|nr:GNAT family N-acetyltransferase [Mycobacterium simulans]SOJ55638.1 hypothetical protein MSIMFB_03120 [Mycobacterium simulans]